MLGRIKPYVTRLLATGAMTVGFIVARPNLGPVAIGRVNAEPADHSARSAARADKPGKAKGEEGPEFNPYDDPSQCTYLAWELAAQAGHRMPNFGDAADWRAGAIASGYRVIDSLSPSAVDSVAVWGPGVGGASYVGHVGWVTAVDGDRFLVRDRNWFGFDDERWVPWEPGISFITFDGGAGDIQVVEPLTLVTSSPEAGGEVRIRFKVKNTGNTAVTLDRLVAAGRRGKDWSDQVADFSSVDGITLNPGDEYVYEQPSTFLDSGEYVAEPVMQVDGGWTGIAGGNRVHFTVHERELPKAAPRPDPLAAVFRFDPTAAGRTLRPAAVVAKLADGAIPLPARADAQNQAPARSERPAKAEVARRDH